MPSNQDIHCGNCDHCDYEWWQKSKKSEEMVKRLHKKKCPKTGRTKEPEWKGRLLSERAIFSRAQTSIKILADGENRKATARFVNAVQMKEDYKNGKVNIAHYEDEVDILRRRDTNICDFPDCDEDCGKYGNNPVPALPPGMKCCDKCNIRKVIPARLAFRA
jgi:hypothetical protein